MVVVEWKVKKLFHLLTSILHTLITAGASLVSLVSFLNANPKIAIVLVTTVLNMIQSPGLQWKGLELRRYSIVVPSTRNSGFDRIWNLIHIALCVITFSIVSV